MSDKEVLINKEKQRLLEEAADMLKVVAQRWSKIYYWRKGDQLAKTI